METPGRMKRCDLCGSLQAESRPQCPCGSSLFSSPEEWRPPPKKAVAPASRPPILPPRSHRKQSRWAGALGALGLVIAAFVAFGTFLRNPDAPLGYNVGSAISTLFFYTLFGILIGYVIDRVF
jgi:hypothetical protein